MKVSTGVREILKRRGSTQAWVINQMNALNPSLQMTRNKLSAITCGTRKMTGDELLAFCKVTGTDPDYFLQDSAEQPSA